MRHFEAATGITVRLMLPDERPELPDPYWVALYRVAQEALTNVLKHAGSTARATVTIEYGTEDLVIDVSDDGRGAVSRLSESGGGNGLIGMRERVDIYGGSLSAGPRSGGGYAIRVVLPTDESGPRSNAAKSVRPIVDNEH